MGLLIEELRRREAAARAEADRAAQPDGGACAGAGQGRGAGLAAGDRPGGSHAGAGGGCQRGAARRACGGSSPGLADRAGDGAAARGRRRCVGAAQSCQDLLEVVADAGRPLKAGQIAAAAGLRTDTHSAPALANRPSALRRTTVLLFPGRDGSPGRRRHADRQGWRPGSHRRIPGCGQ
jgi:hypothetical protein